MATSMRVDESVETEPSDHPAEPVKPSFGHPQRVGWVREGVLVLAFYYVYQTVRRFAHSGTTEAFKNALRIQSWEKDLHIYAEHDIQQKFLSAEWLVRFLNVYYGTLHFVITAGLLIWVYHYRHSAYRRMRNLLGITTGLALIGYWTFPLAPPRLFHPYFVDTLDTIGGLWSYNSPVAKAVANDFAAMPSLHFGWALWCGIVFFTLTTHRLTRAMVVIYPLLTLTAVVVTANHYFLDAVGGAVILVAAVFIQRGFERWTVRRGPRTRRPVLFVRRALGRRFARHRATSASTSDGARSATGNPTVPQSSAALAGPPAEELGGVSTG